MRASPARRNSSCSERFDNMVMRAASTVSLISSTRSFNDWISSNASTAICASARCASAPKLSSAWRATANVRFSTRPFAKFSLASELLSARFFSITSRSACRRASRARWSLPAHSVSSPDNKSWAERAACNSASVCTICCFSSSNLFTCSRCNAAVDGVSSAQIQ